jgi:glycosyltransferase involved in cell wall biosynthesis
MTEPLLSVLLPVKNGEAFLAAALDSIRCQTLRDWELVCVDDGSTDATPRILADFACQDPRIRVIIPCHGGLVGALATGLAACRGR